MNSLMNSDHKVTPHKKVNMGDMCKDEVDELKDAFKIFEEETDKIKPSSVIKIFKDLAYDLDNEHILEMLEYLNNNADEKGMINFAQFLNGCNKYLGKNTPTEYLEKVFNMFVDTQDKTHNVSLIGNNL